LHKNKLELLKYKYLYIKQHGLVKSVWKLSSAELIGIVLISGIRSNFVY